MQRVLGGVSKEIVRRIPGYGILLICLVAAASVLLTMQGWKSRIVAFDDLTYIYDAEKFLKTGALPQHGDTDSYGSYSPPGTAWLMLPGMILYTDPRRFEYVGAAFLHLVTLIGVFLLARRFFSTGCAYLAVALYGLSGIALFYAGSLWPIGRPDFYIWVVLLACMWVLKNDARYLSASLIVWALGMYVDMSIIPTVFIYPVLWLYFRPVLRIKPLLIAALIALVAWSPYLHFEAARGFIDIRSQLLQQPIPSANYRRTWCDPSLTLRTWEDAGNLQPPGFTSTPLQPDNGPAHSALVVRWVNAWKNLISNFDQIAPGPAASIALLLVMSISLLLFTALGSVKNQPNKTMPSIFWHDPVRLVSLGMLLGGAALEALSLAYQLHSGGVPTGGKFLFVSKVSKIMLWSGIALFAAPWILYAANHLLRRLRWQIPVPEDAAPTNLLSLNLLAPWFILLLFSEPEKPERFMWLWPLQCIFLAAFVTDLLPRLGLPRYLIYASQVVLLLLLMGNSFLLQRVNSWIETGWAGIDGNEVRVVDAIVRDARAQGKERVAIGYQMFIYPFMAEYNVSNPIYKVGAELDLLFRFKDGLVNEDQCAEGLSPKDDYRIVEIKPQSSQWSPREYFSVPPDKNARLIGQVGRYQIYKGGPLLIDD